MIIINGSTVNPETITANGNDVKLIKVVDSKHDRSEVVWPEPMNISLTISETAAQLISTVKYHWRYILYVNGAKVADVAANTTANITTAGIFGDNNVITARVYKGYNNSYYDYTIGQMPLGTRIIQFVEVPEKVTVKAECRRNVYASGGHDGRAQQISLKLTYVSGALHSDSCPTAYTYNHNDRQGNSDATAYVGVYFPDWSKPTTVYSYLYTRIGSNGSDHWNQIYGYSKDGQPNDWVYSYSNTWATNLTGPDWQRYSYEWRIITDSYNQTVANGDIVNVPYTHMEFNLL